MTLNLAGYTVGANRPLNNARILWQMIAGTVQPTAGSVQVSDNRVPLPSTLALASLGLVALWSRRPRRDIAT